MQRFDNIAGWQLGEVAFLYGAVELAFGLMDMIFSGFDPDFFAAHVRLGRLDQLLLRPVNLTLQVLGAQFAMRRLGRIAQGALVLAIAMQLVEIHWTPAKIALSAGRHPQHGGLLRRPVHHRLDDHLLDGQRIEAINIFTYGGAEMMSYPMSVYSDWLRRFFTFILPAIFLNYYPALYFLDKPDPFGLPAWAPFLAPLAGFERAGRRPALLELRPAALPEHRHLKENDDLQSQPDQALQSPPAPLRRVAAPSRSLFSREYRVVKAVDGISFRIDRGELVGYLGPNGAGKSTTLKMLTGLLTPSAGEVLVNRRHALARPAAVRGPHRRGLRPAYHPVVGPAGDRVLPPAAAHLPHPCRPLLQQPARVPPHPRPGPLSAHPGALALSGPAHARRPVRRPAARPDLLFLDEPTIGLDVVAKERIRAFIQQINRERGVTVILTTHDLSDVEKLCERVMIIDHGRLLYDGQLAGLRDRFGGKRRLLVEFDAPYPDVQVAGAQLLEHDGPRALYEFDRQALSASELIGRLSAQYRLRDLEVREPDIEATIRRIYEERLLE